MTTLTPETPPAEPERKPPPSDDKAPEVPPTEPKPEPIRDPPPSPRPKGPYVVDRRA